ncbi:MAG TPA: Ku protein [Mucilaginibacter sp.]|nr:Ku protein [Mucilaginibacter sp.]
MAIRAIWTGTISFGLVSIPIKLYSAVENSELSFDLLDSRDHARIRYSRINEHTKKEVPFDHIVKGYKLNENYVIVEKSDFERVAPEKTKEIKIDGFIDLADVNPVYFEKSYYTAPQTKKNKSYALLLQSLKQSKKAGLAKFVLRNVESLVVVYPVQDVIVVNTIRFAQEIRDFDELNIDKDVTISKKEMDMGLALINTYVAPFDVSQFKNEYPAELMKIIEAKAKGERPTIKKFKPKKPSGDLYDQLMSSLQMRKGA